MNEKSKNKRKGFITEEDVASLLQRYSAATVLALLQEVAQCPVAKIDWNELVKRTSTGISNAWEYQMLWRHLAYHGPLLAVEGRVEPQDDDSDLEYELEAFPHVSSDAAAEAAACVKVMCASRLPCESNPPSRSTVEAPLVINIPNGTSCGPSEPSQASLMTSGVNITVPVSVRKQPLPASTSTEMTNAIESVRGTFPPRRKRNPWSNDEDMELIAAVEKCGEGNWANILKCEFKGNRTASQLSQRWSLIRRKRFRNGASGTNQSGSQRTEAQMAANHALSLAVGHRPTTKNLTAAGASISVSGNHTLAPCSTADPTNPNVNTQQTQKQSQCLPVQTSSSPAGTSVSLEKSQAVAKKGPLRTLGSDSVVASKSAAAAAVTTGTTDTAAATGATGAIATAAATGVTATAAAATGATATAAATTGATATAAAATGATATAAAATGATATAAAAIGATATAAAATGATATAATTTMSISKSLPKIIPGKNDNHTQSNESLKAPFASTVACARKHGQTEVLGSHSGSMPVRPSCPMPTTSASLRPGSVCATSKASQDPQPTTAMPTMTFSSQAGSHPASGSSDQPQPTKAELTEENVEVPEPKKGTSRL